MHEVTVATLTVLVSGGPTVRAQPANPAQAGSSMTPIVMLSPS